MALDILIIVVVGAALVMGAIRGAIAQIGSLAGLVLGIISARLFGTKIALFFSGGAAPGAIEYAGGYVVAFLVVYLLAWLIVRLFRKVVHSAHLGIFDRIAGAVIKGFIWALALSLCLNIYLLIAGDSHEFDNPKKPWRAMIVRLAPATLGFLHHEMGK